VDNLPLLVYPNPLPHGETGYFRLSLPSSAEPYQIAVYLYDAQGKLMLQEIRELPFDAGPDVDISLSPSTQSGNPPGLYFYRVDVSTADYQHTYRGKWLWER